MTMVSPPSHHFLLDLKQQILEALGKLGDRDTQGSAARELEHIALNMPYEGIPIFLSALYETDTNQKVSARKECVRMFGVLAIYHGDLLIPHLSKIVNSIVSRFRDTESGISEACAHSLGMIAANVGREPEGQDGTPSPSVIILFLKPLLDALNEQARHIQIAAALCIDQTLLNARESLLHVAHRLVIRLVKCLGKPTFVAKPQLLKAVGTLFEVTEGTLIDHLPVLVPCLQDLLGNHDWITRKSAAETLIDVITNFGSAPLAHYRDGVVSALEHCRSDKTKPVREVAVKALILWEDIPSPRDLASMNGLDLEGNLTPDRYSPFSSYWHSFVNREKAEKMENEGPKTHQKPSSRPHLLLPRDDSSSLDSGAKALSPATSEKRSPSDRLSFGEYRKLNPSKFEQANQNAGLEKGDWQVEIAVQGEEKPQVVVLKGEAGTPESSRSSKSRANAWGEEPAETHSARNLQADMEAVKERGKQGSDAGLNGELAQGKEERAEAGRSRGDSQSKSKPAADSQDAKRPPRARQSVIQEAAGPSSAQAEGREDSDSPKSERKVFKESLSVPGDPRGGRGQWKASNAVKKSASGPSNMEAGSHHHSEASRRSRRSEEGRTEWNFDREEVLRSIRKAQRSRAVYSEEEFEGPSEDESQLRRVREQLSRMEDHQSKSWAAFQSFLAATEHTLEKMDLRLRSLERLMEFNNQEMANWRHRGYEPAPQQMQAVQHSQLASPMFLPPVYQQNPGLQQAPSHQSSFMVLPPSLPANHTSPPQQQAQQRVYLAVDVPAGSPVQLAGQRSSPHAVLPSAVTGGSPAQQPYRSISRLGSLSKEEFSSLDDATPGAYSRTDSLKGTPADDPPALSESQLASSANATLSSMPSLSFKPPRSPSFSHFSAPAGAQHGSPAAAAAQSPSQAARGKEKRSTQKDRALWNSALEHLRKGEMTEAYRLAVHGNDGGLLVRLMGRTGPVLGELDGGVRRDVLGSLLSMIEANEHMDYILPWIRQLAELEDQEEGGSYGGLNIPREIQLRAVAVLRGYSDQFSSNGWIGAMSGQLASQLSAAWKV